jgi:pre-60S factor REI1
MVVASSASGSSGVTTQAPSQPTSQSKTLQEITDSGSDRSSCSNGDGPAEASNIPVFEPTHCLFCRSISESVDTNFDHMSKSHGMTIPSPHQLTVDPTTLLSYLHLVISVYNECLTCGTQRRSTQAIQQHMLGKEHCAFDISDLESEYREFWNFGEDGADVRVDGENITLPSGRVVMSRSVRTTQQRQRPSASGVNSLTRSNASSLEASISNPSDSSNPSTNTSSTSHKQALTKQDVRAHNLDKQLGTLRSSDRLALAHLPASEQRAILATQHSQLQKARRQERDMQARLQRKNNQTLMKHFVPDVPGPKLG